MQLTQSYRIPQVVHDIASKIVNRIQNDYQKNGDQERKEVYFHIIMTSNRLT